MDPLEYIINFLKQTDEQKVGISLLDVFRKHSSNVEQLDQLGKYYYELKDYKKSIFTGYFSKIRKQKISSKKINS